MLTHFFVWPRGNVQNYAPFNTFVYDLHLMKIIYLVHILCTLSQPYTPYTPLFIQLAQGLAQL